MKIVKGISAASGMVRGVVCLYLNDIEELIPHYEISPEHVPAEGDRFLEAINRVQTGMEQLRANAETLFDKQTAEIVKVHAMMVANETMRTAVLDAIRTKRINAEHAVKDVFDQYLQVFSREKDHFAELAHDYIDIRDRILTALDVAAGKFKCAIGDQGPVIVAVKRLTPALVMNAKREHVLAFIAQEGGVTSHATILARAFAVPIIFNIDVEHELDCGRTVIVDGSLGRVIIDADAKTTSYYDKKIRAHHEKKMICAVRKQVHAATRAGRRITLKVNLSTPQELPALDMLQHDGIGLLRTEFLFHDRTKAPSEEEQYEMYGRIIAAAGGRPVTVRLLDIGDDKLPSYITLPEHLTVDLSLRGALAVEAFRELFIIQAKALLRAACHGPIRFLYPMVSDSSDLATYRAIVAQARRRLTKERKPYCHAALVDGVMIETPAAVMLARELLEAVSFVNIGSNDLLQYTLAAARGNALVEARYHILHPALGKMIAAVAREGNRLGKEVCLCGEIASYEEFYPTLLALGIHSFSVAVGKFDDIKCELFHITPSPRTEQARHLRTFYGAASKKDVDRFFSQFV